MLKNITEIDSYFKLNWNFSANKIAEIKKNEFASYINISNFSIYSTGSYGRLEAHASSDMDIFVCGDTSAKQLESTLKEDIRNMLRDQNLPDLDGDGKYFTIYTIEDMYSHLGTAEDDFRNFFTARMLLLMESQPLFNEDYLTQFRQKIVDFYFRDAEKYTSEFRPYFVMNDILRFWRTMAVNYEAQRTKFLTLHIDDAQKREAQKKKNLKLKFHRIWLCYSALLPLMSKPYWAKEDFLQIFSVTPYERLKATLTDKNWRCEDQFYEMAFCYMKFIQQLQDDKEKPLIKNNTDDIWGQLNTDAEKFRKALFTAISKCPNEDAKLILSI